MISIKRDGKLAFIFNIHHNIKYMVQIPKQGSTSRQKNYALKAFAGGKSKQEIALDCGYSPAVSKSVKQKIESSKGYKNAMIEILKDSDNAVLQILASIKKQDFDTYEPKDLMNALREISTAWEKFNDVSKPKGEDPMAGHNQLRTIVMQRIENQTVNQPLPPTAEKIIEVKPVEEVKTEVVDDKMDF